MYVFSLTFHEIGVLQFGYCSILSTKFIRRHVYILPFIYIFYPSYISNCVKHQPKTIRSEQFSCLGNSTNAIFIILINLYTLVSSCICSEQKSIRSSYTISNHFSNLVFFLREHTYSSLPFHIHHKIINFLWNLLFLCLRVSDEMRELCNDTKMMTTSTHHDLPSF